MNKHMVRNCEKNMLLDGVPVSAVSARKWLIFAIRLMTNKPKLVSYRVIAERKLTPNERRLEMRGPTRLWSGKILDSKDHLLTECSFQNKTSLGVRLILARDVIVPKRIQLYDDRLCRLFWIEVVWRSRREIGCKLLRTPCRKDPLLLSRLKHRFYAVR